MKISAEDIEDIEDRLHNKMHTAQAIADDYGITKGYVYALANGRLGVGRKSRHTGEPETPNEERNRLLRSWPVVGQGKESKP